ncbi:sedoheptulose-7-phosphate:D-glyceraldehyde-3-phosphate glyceronetransferase [Aureococcus anophagefferens]|nr:sedoheptulose-7-phosphate:D-glyceraldehyde-3-phosphate glyceronetransferase [Aureococcus anophagefferens]
MVLLLASLVATAAAFTLPAPRRATATALRASQLEQLAEMTTLSIDTGDLDVIAKYADTGLITDATTNPLFVAQAGTSGDARYVAFVDAAIAYAREHAGDEDVVALAMDRLAVELGLEIVKLVPGYVSTEVDIRASFDTDESVRRARRIIAMYEAAGAVAAAQAGARLISPFPGRVKDWHSANGGEPTYEPADDPGVVEVARIYAYYKKHGHGTICMPASWRPSRGTSDPAFAGSDAPVPRNLEPAAAAAACADGALPLDESAFRLAVNGDMATTTKLAEGINAFIAETAKLEAAIKAKL